MDSSSETNFNWRVFVARERLLSPQSFCSRLEQQCFSGPGGPESLGEASSRLKTPAKLGNTRDCF
jgi:hypothetical protein